MPVTGGGYVDDGYWEQGISMPGGQTWRLAIPLPREKMATVPHRDKESAVASRGKEAAAGR